MYKLFIYLFVSIISCIPVFSLPLQEIQNVQQKKVIEDVKFLNKDNLSYHNNIILLKTRKMQKIDKHNNILLSDVLVDKLESLGVVAKNIRAPFAKYYFVSGIQSESSNRGIERICEIIIEPNDNILEVCKELMKNIDIEYAEPAPIRYCNEFIPNDPEINKQWHLQNIELYKAWEVVKEKKGVLIGISDSGVDINHFDLANNVWKNPKEELNGVDSDGNGKVDDINGWDFVGNISFDDIYYGRWKEDNDPSVKIDQNFHGTHVAGCAAAVINNTIGVAGSAINCKIVASKHAVDSTTDYGIQRGYEGILYLAKLGARIINCSWGGKAYGMTEYDVIQEAISLGSIIFTSAGNEAVDIDISPIYPACYEGCIIVGSNDPNNKVSSFSNYGYATSIFSPGNSIYSTVPNNKYSSQSGTSMASPVAAGVAGLVLSVFPEYNAKQVKHQLRSTGDNVISNNSYKYFKKINAYNAVTYNNPDFPDKVVPGVSVSKISIPPFDKLVNYTEKEITLTLKNYIGKASDLVVNILSLDGYLSSSKFDEIFEVGSMDINEEKTISFDIRLDSLCGIADGKAKLLIEYGDGNFYDFEVIYIPISISSSNKYSFVNVYGASRTGLHYSIHNFNENTAFAVGVFYYGTIYPVLQTITEGNIFSTTEQFSTPSQSIPYTVYALTSKNIIITTATTKGNTFIINTKNKFLTAPSVLEATSLTPFINYMTFFDDQNGILVGDPKGNKWGIAITKNAGLNWNIFENSIPVDSGEVGILNVAAKLDNTIWFGTNKGKIIKINNMGETWSADTVCKDAIITSINFANANRGAAIYIDLKDNKYYLATNDGNKWSKGVFDFSKISTFAIPKYVYGTPTGMFLVVFDNNATYSSKDFGRSWDKLPNKELYDAQFVHIFPQSNNREIKIKTYGIDNEKNNPNKEQRWYPYYVFASSKISLPFGAKYDIKISPDSPKLLDYGELKIGQDSIKTIDIDNIGNRTFAIGNLKIVPANNETSELDFVVSNYNHFIEVYQSGCINVLFSPKTAGQKHAYLYIANNSGDEEIIYELIGNAVFVEFAELKSNKTQIKWDYSGLDLEVFNELDFNLTNVGNIPLDINEYKIIEKNIATKAEEFNINIKDELPLTINAGEMKNVSIKLELTISEDKIYTREASLILYNTGRYPEYEISLLVIGNDSLGKILILNNNEIFSYPIPNPSSYNTNVTVYLEKPQYYSIDLFSIDGNKISNAYKGYGVAGSNIVNINLENLEIGSYYLILNLNGKYYFNKIIKQ